MGRCLTLAATLAAGTIAMTAGCSGTEAPAGPVLEYDACQALTLTPDSAISGAQLAGIAAGVQLWNAAARTRLSVAGSAPDETTASVPLHFQGAAPPFHGLYEDGQIFINDDLSGAPQAVVIAHEVGHAFGLVHVPASERASLMNPGNVTVEPTATDVETLAARWGTCR